MLVTAPTPPLVGSIRRFGPAGVLYEVVADVDGTVARIRIIETGEETQYRIAEILRDPTE